MLSRNSIRSIRFYSSTIKFPESVEKEFRDLKLKNNNNSNDDKKLLEQPPSSLSSIAKSTGSNNDNQEQKLTPTQIEAINNTKSSLYTPKNPLDEPSKSDLIRQRIESIQKRLDNQRIKEELKIKLLEEEHTRLSKPELSDFKRPLTSCFLFASAIYITIQYLWEELENEEFLIEMQNKSNHLEKQLQESLDEQKTFIINYQNNHSKHWWKFW